MQLRLLAALWLFLSGCPDDDTSSNDAGPGRDASGQDTETADGALQPDATSDADGGGEDGATDAGIGIGELVPGFRSGTRLTAISYGTPEQPIELRFFYDAVLDEHCYFAVAEDGEIRCLPINIDDITEEIYTDDQCSQSVFTVSGCEPRLFRYELASRDCEGRFVRVYHQVEPVAFPDPYWNGSPDSCFGPNAAEPFQTTAYRDTSTVTWAPSTFVLAEQQMIQIGERLGIRRFAGEDGSYLNTSLVDATYGPCDARIAADDVLRCLPRTPVFAEPGLRLFSDSICTVPLAVSIPLPDTCADDPYLVENLGERFAVRQNGGRHQGTSYTTRSGTCEPLTTGEPTYEIGAEVPASSFAPVSRVLIPFDPIAAEFFGDDANLPILRLGMRTAGGKDCDAVWFNSSEIYCANFRVLYSRLYADSNCTQRLLEVEDAAEVPEHAVEPLGGVCVPDKPWAGDILYAVGAEHPGDVYRDTGTCTAEARASGIRYFNLTEAPPSVLPRIEERR